MRQNPKWEILRKREKTFLIQKKIFEWFCFYCFGILKEDCLIETFMWVRFYDKLTAFFFGSTNKVRVDAAV